VQKTSASGAPRPEQAANFQTLYAVNCVACHGEEGRGNVAIALASPVYLQISDDTVIRNAIATGDPGELSPAFSLPMGGLLSDQDINVLVDGIRSWSKPQQFAGVQVPPRTATGAGNAKRGAEVFRTFCSLCHLAAGKADTAGTGSTQTAGGSILDPSVLALLNDQDLRTLVIVGMPQFGMPDWRGDMPGRPLTDQQIGDVVAWLASYRVQHPGQPYVQEGQTQNTNGGK